MVITQLEIDERFDYHQPSKDQTDRMVTMRAQAKALAETIVQYTNDCREQALAITHLEQALMMANAAVVRRG